MEILGYLGAGLVAGICSGLFGIGGGIVIIPILTLLMKIPLQKAQGTSLAILLLPVGLLGVMEFHKKQAIVWNAVGWAAFGLFLGAYFGAKLNVSLDPATMRKVFSIFLIMVAIQVWNK